jgi:SAM-dependent methyltransferase
MSISTPIQASYTREQAHYDGFAPGGPMAHLANAWFDPGDDAGAAVTVDHWRHRRAFAHLDPLINALPRAAWLTIGDGRCASDAQYLKRRGAKAIASDISPTLLIQAHQRGVIDEYRVENAEHLSLEDESIDIALCMESYHHFPRPMLAIYEMLRVARTAVVLHEPRDRFMHSPPPEAAWNFLKSLPRRIAGRFKPDAPYRFEPAGNFIYTLSRRELQKAAMALDLPCLAFAEMNDCYIEGVETQPALDGNPLFEQVRARIRRLDLLCRLGIRQPQMLTAVIFKQPPDTAMLSELKTAGYQIEFLPKNPYRRSPAPT